MPNYPDFTENAVITLRERYLSKGPDGQPVEDIPGLFKRVSKAVAAAEDNEIARTIYADVFEDQMRSLRWMPSSPILMNAGIERMGALAACYVLPVEDDLDAIFDRVKDAANITKQGGGIGYAFSRLRGSGSIVASSGGKASGPVSFIENFDIAARTVKQGGRRRAAQMGVLRVDHPDILEFINCKTNGDPKHLANFNLSVAVTDEFMDAVRRGVHYYLRDPNTGQTVDSMNALWVWRKLAEAAHVGGDPGVVFIDRANQKHGNPHLGTIETPNACSESFMLPYETCILGSINVLAHYDPTGPLSINSGKLRESVYTLTRFLDNVIDVSEYPLPEIKARTKATRRIGLGVMGVADWLIERGIKYDSPQGVAAVASLMGFIQEETHAASGELAKERGVYPAWVGSRYQQRGKLMRNTDPVVIAPTGTISIIAGVSSGIEPIFAREYTRNVLDGKQLVERHPALGRVPDDVLVTAHEIAPVWHLKMQAAVQSYTDNAVSKTVNMPNAATVDNIETIYTEAYRLGLKSISVYRDGSKSSQVLVTNNTVPDDLTACPECDAELTHAEGCVLCTHCSWGGCTV